MSIIWTILILGVMIFVHELGHFLAARSFGVHVEEFALGMGPALIKKQKGETLYSLRVFPIGGYCKMEGEDESVDSPGSLSALSAWKRLVVLVAGAFMNILLALIIFIGISFAGGDKVVSPIIDSFVTSDAPIAVFSEGDRIVKMDNTKINIYNDLQLKMYENNGEPIEITVRRGNEYITKTVTPEKTEDGYKLGFYSGYEDNTALVSLKNGFYETLFSVKSVFWSIKQMITGAIGLDSVSGPIGVAGAIGEVTDTVNTLVDESARTKVLILSILNIMALIGANLGVMNLLPLPALDGGRVLFTLIEIITRKKVPEKFEGWVHGIGLILFLALAVVITFSDIIKLFK